MVMISLSPSVYQGVQRIISPLGHLKEGGGGVIGSLSQIRKPIGVGKNFASTREGIELTDVVKQGIVKPSLNTSRVVLL